MSVITKKLLKNRAKKKKAKEAWAKVPQMKVRVAGIVKLMSKRYSVSNGYSIKKGQ